jgi:hypothetical protein
MGKLSRYFIKLGGEAADIGSIKFGFRAPEPAYDNIGGALGVTKVEDNNKGGIMYGANKPRPAKVRIAYQKSTEKTASAIRFCEYDKLNSVLLGGANALKIKIKATEYNINEITLVGG